MLAACSDEGGDAAQRPDEPAPAVSVEVEEAPSAPAVEVVPDVRQVIPGREANAPQAGQEVVRMPAPAPPIQPPRAVNLGIVVVEEATILSTRRGTVRLQGTLAVDPSAPCPLADGRTPTCATLARTAMRRFVGQRSVTCALAVRDDADQAHQAPCTLGETNLAYWAVSQGWAYAAGDASEALKNAQTEADDARRGLWASINRDGTPR